MKLLPVALGDEFTQAGFKMFQCIHGLTMLLLFPGREIGKHSNMIDSGEIIIRHWRRTQ
jgi:hypothetical protein